MRSGPKAVAALLLCALALFALVQWRAAANENAAEAAYPPSGQFVEVDGTRIHVHVSGEGPDIVLIHGASGSLRDATFRLEEKLSQAFRVIAVDRPGMGWSDRPRGYGGIWNVTPEPPALQARLLQKATDAIGVSNPVVVGHSFGGAVALAWALERPDETAALVLLAAASNPWEGDLGPLYQVNSSRLGSALVIPLITAFAPRGVVEQTVSSIFEPQDVPGGYLAHFGPQMTLRRGTMRANAQQVNGLRPFIVEMSQRYHTLQMPVEILHGTDDTIVPLNVHSVPLSGQIDSAVLTRLEGVGHMPQHVSTDAVLAAIDRAAARAGLR